MQSAIAPTDRDSGFVPARLTLPLARGCIRILIMPCPICEGESLRAIFATNGKAILLCSKCGVRFLDPFPSPDGDGNFFTNLGEFAKRTSFGNRRIPERRIFNTVLKFRSSGTILDIGCAAGNFLREFGPSWERYGVELSPELAASATDVNVYVGDLRAAHYRDAFFDVITMLDMFYYLPDPKSELVEVKRVLKPDGVLMIELPNAGPRLARSGTDILRTSDHLFYYDPPSIAFLLRTCGFREVTTVPLPANPPANPLRRFVYGSYDMFSNILFRISNKGVNLTPRFLSIFAQGETSHSIGIKS